MGQDEYRLGIDRVSVAVSVRVQVSHSGTSVTCSNNLKLYPASYGFSTTQVATRQNPRPFEPFMSWWLLGASPFFSASVYNGLGPDEFATGDIVVNNPCPVYHLAIIPELKDNHHTVGSILSMGYEITKACSHGIILSEKVFFELV